MKALYIDTHATRSFFLGFYNNNELICASGLDAATEIIETIDRISDNEYEKIIINKGPGSLTGLRIGSSFAQGLSLAKNIPVFAVSIWTLLLHEHPDIDIFFYTGTKKWIKKNKNEETIIENNFSSNASAWISNKPNLLTELDQGKNIPFPDCIKLMHKYQFLASNEIDILYPINLFIT